MYKSILVCVDLTEPHSWEQAFPIACQLARGSSATLHIVTVVPPYGMSIVGSFFPKDFEEKALESAKGQLKALVEKSIPDDIDCKVHVAHGTVYEEILHAAKATSADLIVLTAHRPKLQDYLLGPNAARVARHASQSVLIVRDED